MISDFFGTMSSVTGLDRKQLESLADEVKVNHAKLDSCARHDFEPILPLVHFRQRYRCVHCGGDVDFLAYRWHEIGRRGLSSDA